MSQHKRMPHNEFLVHQLATVRQEIADTHTEMEKEEWRSATWAFLRAKERKLKRQKKRIIHMLNRARTESLNDDPYKMQKCMYYKK